MKYAEIILTMDTRKQICEKLQSIVSKGIFIIDSVSSEKLTDTKKFDEGDAWKPAEVIECEQPNDVVVALFPNIPKETCLIRIKHPDGYPTCFGQDDFFTENDVFYFTKNTVRIRFHSRKFLLRIKVLNKKNFKGDIIEKWNACDKRRSTFFFDEASALNIF